MNEVRTDEEQVEALKTWWKENGKSLVIMIVVALVAVYGFKAWQQQAIDTSEKASAMYQQLIDVVVPTAGANSSENVATSKHLAETLRQEYGDSQYAKFSALLMAKVAVNAGDFDKAEEELDWLLSVAEKPMLISIVSIRKAQILAEQDKFSEALALLKNVSIEALKVQSMELEGDIYLAQGDKSKARSAYEKAIAINSASTPILSMKLNDLTTEEG
ncbi:MAG: tetratricopeptide repeat protein [Oceanospirillaceae bacterium]|nr:tetratricopeptide repeat protein [Oceanospirillaceae bacterium]